MTALQQLADLVGLPLPARYCSLLNQYPAVLLTARRSDSPELDAGTVAEVELLADPAAVLKINQEARACSVPEPTGEEFFWPDQLIVIGETGSGDYYCIDAEGELAGVLVFEHLPVEFSEIADSLDDFVNLLIESFAG